MREKQRTFEVKLSNAFEQLDTTVLSTQNNLSNKFVGAVGKRQPLLYTQHVWACKRA